MQASEGNEAIRILREQEIHLVLTDIMMPGLDGISLMKYVKKTYPQIPVITITAHPEEITDLKPDALLAKPFGPEALLSWIDRLI